MLYYKRLICPYCSSSRCGHDGNHEAVSSAYFFHNLGQMGALVARGVRPDKERVDGKEKA
jgi:hypothetical protein